MPNVIAIIDDAKVRRQIETYCRELDAEGIRLRMFNSSDEFEQKYFKKESKASQHPLAKHAGLAHFSTEQLEFFLNQNFAAQPAFPHKVMRVKVNLQTRKADAIEPSVDADVTLFDRYPEDFKNQTEVFASLLPPEFMADWTGFYKKAVIGSTQILLPFRANANELCLIKVRGQKLSGTQVMMQIEDVTDQYKAIIDDEKQRRAAHAAETEELQLMSEIHLILYKVDCIHEKSPVWISRIWQELRKAQFFPKEGATRFVLLKYEDDNLTKLDVLHRHLDDLIYLPLDRLIFFQKLEIIFNLPKKTKPSYLFTQEVELDIEISKISRIERFSDVGLAIRNPVRLVPGLIAHFFFTPPGEQVALDIWGKVIRSEPHPEVPNQFLVYFSYFALKKNDLTLIRRFMAKGAKYQAFRDSERVNFLYNPDDLYATDEDRRLKGVAILDVDEEHGNQAKLAISKDVGQIKVVAESSASAFLTRFLSKSGGTGINLSGVTLPADPEMYSPIVILTVNPGSLEMNGCLTPPTEDQKIFDHPALELFSSPKGWLKIFSSDPENVMVLTEACGLVKPGKPLTKVLVANTPDGSLRLVRAELKWIDANPGITLEITPATPDDLKRKQSKDEKIPSLDLMIIDVNLIPGEVGPFIEGIRERARQAGMMRPEHNLKIILVAEPNTTIDVRKYAAREIVGLVIKPTDPRLLAFQVASALDIRYSMYTFDNIGWINIISPIHVAKEAKLESLSEFGATIRHSRPIAPGTVLYLRGQLFENAPNRCLAARFYHCEDHPKYKGEFLCSMIYFGINDAFMKYARKWFRETYAQSKQVEGNSQ